jgi:hypothetical protein
MLYSSVEIALYLNLATIEVKAAAGKLRYLMGNDTTTIPFQQTAQSEETQCVEFGSALWIANNDDGDTKTQQELIKKIGVSTRAQLVDHVDTYASRLFPRHSNKYVTGGMSAKQKLLYSLTMRHGVLPFPAALVPGGGGVVEEHRLGAVGEPGTALVFVVGSYVGDAGLSCHAEQKLMAALGKYLKVNTIVGSVTVSGIKMPCAYCEEALDDVQKRLTALKTGITLRTRNGYVDELRGEAGLNMAHPSNIKTLDIDTYFDAPKQS